MMNSQKLKLSSITSFYRKYKRLNRDKEILKKNIGNLTILLENLKTKLSAMKPWWKISSILALQIWKS